MVKTVKWFIFLLMIDNIESSIVGDENYSVIEDSTSYEYSTEDYVIKIENL